MKRLALALAVLALAPPAALAETAAWKMDPAHSSASFTVRHLGISNVRGEFQKMDGEVMLDEQDPTKSSVEVTIDAASVNTRNSMRDNDLRSENFFDVAKHPKLTFKSTRIVKAGDGYEVTGDLTMRGTTKPVTLQVNEFTKAITDGQGAQRRAVAATGKLDRRDFGLTWNSMVEATPMVGDEVKLEIAAEFVKAPASPAGQAKAEEKAAKEQKPAKKK